MVRLKFNLKNNGFSLLEVIITVAILSTGIVVILQAFSFSARVTGLVCDITNAVFLAQDKMQELEFKEKQNLINREPPVVEDKTDKFAWKYVLNPEPDFNLYRLDFDITWQRTDRKERISLNTYLR